MYIDGLKNTDTQRVTQLVLMAHTAADELLLTEIFNVISKPNYAKNIQVNYPDSDPRLSMVWTPTEETLKSEEP